MSHKFCNECGAKQPSDAKFCSACGHRMAGPEAVVQDSAPPTPATSTAPNVFVLQAAICPNCGAALDLSGGKSVAKCEHCDTQVVHNAQAERFESQIVGECPSCQSPTFEGETLCSACGHVVQVTDDLLARARKFAHNQRLYRADFPELESELPNDEMAMGNAYGFVDGKEVYYLATSKRLIVGRILKEQKGGFLGMFAETEKRIGGIYKSYTFEDITAISDFGQLYYPFQTQEELGPAMMDFEITTFSAGRIGHAVFFEQNPGYYYQDAHNFLMRIQEAFGLHEEKITSLEASLVKIGLDRDLA